MPSQNANLLRCQGDYDEAIRRYQTALRQKPDVADAHLNLGLALAGKKDYDGAIAAYRECLRVTTPRA